MKERQCLYTDAQLNIWLLLRLLTDGSEVSNQHLACRLLSMWHWVSALDLPTCPPAPSSLNIGHWLWEDCKVNERQKWIEAYVCTLQHVGKASEGCYWTSEDRTMTPEVSKLVETFMAVTGTCIPSRVVRECWPSPWEDTPQQDLQGV